MLKSVRRSIGDVRIVVTERACRDSRRANESAAFADVSTSKVSSTRKFPIRHDGLRHTERSVRKFADYVSIALSGPRAPPECGRTCLPSVFPRSVHRKLSRLRKGNPEKLQTCLIAARYCTDYDAYVTRYRFVRRFIKNSIAITPLARV